MSNILCIYYSRTGKTRAAMQEIAQELGAETVELRDSVNRRGFSGAVRCGLDAVRSTCRPLRPYQTRLPLEEYDLVILGTPIWAGRCSSPMKAFLKENGKRLRNVSYVVTRGSEVKADEVYQHMDRYVPAGHLNEVCLRSGSVGYIFWREDYLRTTRDILNRLEK